MKTFFPNYISHVIQLLDRYYEFTASKDSTIITAIPVLLERIENLRRKFTPRRGDPIYGIVIVPC
jgi:hypothetical protein